LPYRWNRDELYGVATYKILDATGNSPEIVLLKGTAAAKLLNLARGRNSDEIRLLFFGIVLEPDPGEADRLEIRLVGRTQQVPLPRPISRATLEQGEVINLDFPPTERSLAGTKVSGTARLVQQFDPVRRVLKVVEASGSLTVKTWLGTTSDHQAIRDLEAVPSELDLSDKPIRRYEF
jgi:hypothetical protein